MQLVFASTNAHKASEVAALLRGTALTVRTLAHYPDIPEPPEDADTFEGNALAKARFVFARLGVPAIADDSGLEVDALGGAPGVHSKRFSPEATHATNNALLLDRLRGVRDRTARFRCVVALVAPGFEDTVHGACAGHIVDSARGVAGFGYDPLFAADALGGRTMAEATMDEKNAISHRGAAFRQLPDLLARAGLLAYRSS